MRCLLYAWVLLAAMPALADISAPLLYTRTEMRVLRASPPDDAFLPWEDKSRGDKGVILDTEIRDGATFYNQQGWFNLSGLSENHGVLLAFAAPVIAPVSPSDQYTPLDVLMIDKEGKILQIIPKLVLSELDRDIYPANPILALLFLKGGACERLSIKPGDYIEYKLFKKPPAVITAPVNPK